MFWTSNNIVDENASKEASLQESKCIFLFVGTPNAKQPENHLLEEEHHLATKDQVLVSNC